jgi:signal transduction histidine kinase
LLSDLNQLLMRMRDALRTERRFTADASHELRTPLAAIRANAQVLLGARDEAEKRSSAADLLASVDRGTRLVEQLMALARADAQDDRGSRESVVALDELVREQVQEHAALAARRGVHLDAHAEPATTTGVPALLAVMLRNLIDNALRYTQAGGRVTVSSSTAGKRILVSVSDTGPGIPLAERERIFERFYRVGSNDEPGSGLGLSIVRRIADLHDATVTIADGPDHRGAVVTVSF